MTTLLSMSVIFLFLSVVSCFLSNSWVMVWVSLEVNTMSFCAVLLFLMGKETLHKESIIKYFIVQSVASALLIMSSADEVENSAFIAIWLVVAVLVNIGSAPFHQWFINVSNSLPLEGGMMLITTQNILPVFLISLLELNSIIVFVIANMVVGTISQYYSNKLITILSLSSVANLAWLVAASQICTSTIWAIVTLYIANVALVFMYISGKESNNDNNNSGDTLSTILILSSLAGMPPLMVFLPNWIISNEMIEQSTLMPIILLLTLSSVSMYIYLRMFTPTLATTPSVGNNFSLPKPLNITIIITLLMATVTV